MLPKNSFIIIEHNLDVIKLADHIIDIYPEGGKHGGEIIATRTPEELIKAKNSIAKFLKGNGIKFHFQHYNTIYLR
ncbi:MAG: hypothetical protein U0T85_02755 [Cloacibacterium normanense]